MTFQTGQLTSTDLSPNAGILGTQIADRTLQFRNFSEDAFKVVEALTGSFTITSGSGGTPASSTFTIAHNLNYVPLALYTVQITTDSAGGNTGIFPLPFISLGTGGGTTNVFIVRSFVRVRGVDTANFTFEYGTIAGTLTLAGTVTVYVLEQTATK